LALPGEDRDFIRIRRVPGLEEADMEIFLAIAITMIVVAVALWEVKRRSDGHPHDDATARRAAAEAEKGKWRGA
jgi:hypothetical protein